MSFRHSAPVSPRDTHSPAKAEGGPVIAADYTAEVATHSSNHCAPPGAPAPLCPLEGGAEPEEDGEGEAIVLREDDEEEDCAPIRVAPEPGEPTADEVEAHRTTHLPYRNWCEDLSLIHI